MSQPLKIEVVGAIGETNDFYKLPLKDVKQIHMDLQKMTFINSIGVKNWIIWNMKIPMNCKVSVFNAPLMMISQASIVMGFMPHEKFVIESFWAPFACTECSQEKLHLFTRGKEFAYPSGADKEWYILPKDLKCTKCNVEMEADFLEAKVFAFLKPQVKMV